MRTTFELLQEAPSGNIVRTSDETIQLARTSRYSKSEHDEV